MNLYKVYMQKEIFSFFFFRKNILTGHFTPAHLDELKLTSESCFVSPFLVRLLLMLSYKLSVYTSVNVGRRMHNNGPDPFRLKSRLIPSTFLTSKFRENETSRIFKKYKISVIVCLQKKKKKKKKNFI